MSREIRFDLSPRTLLTLLGVAVGVYLLIQLWFVLVLILIALVLVGTLLPVVRWLELRNVPRSLALLLVFLGLAASLFLIGLATIPTLFAQVMDVVQRAPAIQERLADRLSGSQLLAPLARTVRNAKSAELLAWVGQYALDASTKVIVFLGYGMTTLFLALYIIAGRDQTIKALDAVVPRRHHERSRRILRNLETIVGGYVRGQVLTSVLMTMVVWVLLTVFRAPSALSLSVFAGVADVLPFIGGLLVTVPTVLAALTQGVVPAIVVAVVMVVYQEVESRILVPRVYGRVLRLSPASVIVAVLVGGTLLGILGALLALPIAAGLRMIFHELRGEGEELATAPVTSAPVHPQPSDFVGD